MALFAGLVRGIRRWLDRPGRRAPVFAERAVTAVGDHSPGTGDTLVVYVHEFATRGRSRATVRRLLGGKYGDGLASLGRIDLLAPSYSQSPFANTSPWELAAELQGLVDGAWRARPGGYPRVVLVGYSAGALLVRKAVVFGLGQREDHPDADLGREQAWTWAEPTPGRPSPIERIVLVAGVNRGWSLERRPPDMLRRIYVVYRALLLLARTRLTARFIMALERGEPFVADLRVQWLRLARRLGDAMPLTVQLLGTIDDIVDPADSKDVLATRGASFIAVPHTSHVDMLWLDDRDPANGPDRRARLLRAIAAPVADLRDEGADTVRATATTKLAAGGVQSSGADYERAVFLMHGIRDNADWCHAVRRRIVELDPRAYCLVPSYGHFSLVQFLLFGARRRNVRWFMDQYTETLAMVEAADGNTHFVGHSNGTYLLARALTDYATLRIGRVALAGSVVPRSFPWDRFQREGRIRALRNDRAAGDWIVGIFPGFYQLLAYWLPWARFFSDIGNGGLRGFDRSCGLDHHEVYYLPGGHGAGVAPANHASLARFVLGQPWEPPPTQLRPVGWVDWASNLSWIVWLVLAGVLVVAAPMLLAAQFPAHATLAVVLWFAFLVAVLATV